MPGKIVSVNRVDFMPWPDEGPNGEYMVEKMVLTDEGFLKGRAIATNVGVFPYTLADGTVQYELRPPEEVFDDMSIQSAKGLPLTNNHPPVMVNADNSKEYSVGFTGDNIHLDQYHLSVPISITEKEAVEDAQEGKQALSMGYTADMDNTPGVWMGVRYDAVQRNIKYNHLAIVPQGRAGDAAKMKLDSSDNIGVMKADSIDADGNLIMDSVDLVKVPKIDIEGASSMKKIVIDGFTYEVADENLAIAVQKKIDELEQVKADADQLATVKTELAEATAKADQLKEDNETLKGEKETLEKADHSDEIQKAVKARLDLERSAESAGVEVKADASDEDLKKEIILSVYPKAKLDEKDPAYIQARFDGAIETLEESSGNEAFKGDSLKDEGKSKSKKKDESNKDEFDSDQSRKDMIDRMHNRSVRKED